MVLRLSPKQKTWVRFLPLLLVVNLIPTEEEIFRILVKFVKESIPTR